MFENNISHKFSELCAEVYIINLPFNYKDKK